MKKKTKHHHHHEKNTKKTPLHTHRKNLTSMSLHFFKTWEANAPGKAGKKMSSNFIYTQYLN